VSPFWSGLRSRARRGDGEDAVTVYNRWAHIALDPENGPEVDLTLAHGDMYSIRIDPMSDVWRRLRIRYVVFPFAVANPEFLGATSLVLELPDSHRPVRIVRPRPTINQQVRGHRAIDPWWRL
jgi:hypothetical protein